MITLVILGAVILVAAFRLRHSPEQGWCRALAISTILFVIYATRAAIRGTAGDCDVHIAVSNDATSR